jgi:hypothetical protein
MSGKITKGGRPDKGVFPLLINSFLHEQSI